VLTLGVLGVRDWRCYGVTFLWYPVLQNFLIGSITSLLALGLAVLWRVQRRPRSHVRVAAVVDCGQGLPLACALLAWGNPSWPRGPLRAVGIRTVGISLSWALVGFGGLTSYPRLLDELSRSEPGRATRPLRLGLALGLSTGEARRSRSSPARPRSSPSSWSNGVRGRDPDADRQAFILAIAARFLFSPIVWTHYLAALTCPIAITRRNAGPTLVRAARDVATTGQSDGDAWRSWSAWGSGRSSWQRPSSSRAPCPLSEAAWPSRSPFERFRPVGNRPPKGWVSQAFRGWANGAAARRIRPVSKPRLLAWTFEGIEGRAPQ
jgi:hypothetical protein